MQYVDCDRAKKQGNLCLGYGWEEIDEPCEQCKNCIKCEGGYYQLAETTKELTDENNKLLDVINNQDVKIADLEKENKNLEGCLFAEQEHTLMSEKQIEKMKCCQNCKWQYCECSSAFIDKDTGKETKHCWNEEKEKYCDVGFEGKYQCWELRE